MKIIILIMTSSDSKSDYKKLEDTIRETWFNYGNNQVEILFYSDNQHFREKYNEVFFNKDKKLIITPSNDGYINCTIKTLKTLEWLNKNYYDYDYVYRSNLGAYVNVDKLLNFLKDKPKKKFYCGIIGNNQGVSYASGSGYFLSKDLVDLIVQEKDNFKNNIVDDVYIGVLLNKLGISLDNRAIRWNLCDGESSFQIGGSIVEEIKDDEIYHVRLRSLNRESDIENMKKLYSKKY